MAGRIICEIVRLREPSRKNISRISPFFFFSLLGWKGLRMFGRDPPWQEKKRRAFFFHHPFWLLKNEIIISRAGRCCCSIHGPSSITSSFRFRSTDEFTVMSCSSLLLLFSSFHSFQWHTPPTSTWPGQFLVCKQRTGNLPTRFRVSTALYRTYISLEKSVSQKESNRKREKKKIYNLVDSISCCPEVGGWSTQHKRKESW